MQGLPFRVMCFALLALAVACSTDRRGGRPGIDSGPIAVDASGIDSGPGVDGGPGIDGGGTDASLPDGSTPRDSGGPDSGPRDAGPPDAGPPPRDAGPVPDTISAIQRGTIPAGRHVIVRNVVVTGVYSTGIWVQDPSAGSTYSGIRVFVGGAPTVSRNDRVDVEGDVLEYFDDTEIDSAIVTRRGTATPISPARVRVSQATTEPYEGVLVELTDITSVLSSYDCSVDNPACFDSGLWQVNGTAGIVVWDFTYESTNWTSRIGDTPVTGIMSWRFNRRRIMPRTTADFGP